MTTEIKKENNHLVNLVDKILEDFNKRVKSEQDISNVLLKGHLLVENMLREDLAILDITKGINRISFYEKTKRLSETSTGTVEMLGIVKEIVPILFALNETRNNLAHNLEFKVSETDVNNIGLNIGSSFILQKYKTGSSNTRENLLFCLDYIVDKLALIIFVRIEELKTKSVPV